MNFEIIAVGTELLLGQIVNTNAAYLSQRLSELGFNVYFQTVVGDNPDRLKEALRIASERADAVITTGGLGPTNDDLTKETVAEFCDLECVLCEESLERIKKRFNKQGSYMSENNIKQAYMPEGSIILQNNHGTAPGAVVEHNDKIFIVLPGPPSEMKAMFEESVMPYLKTKTDGVIHSVTLREFGIGESQAEEKLKELMKNQSNPTIAPYAKTGEVTFRLTAKAENVEKAKEMLVPLEKKVREILGVTIYGYGDNGSLQKTLCEILTEKGMKIATAESCTGGLLAKKITEISGSSVCFECGAVTYSNEQKIRLLGVKEETLKKYGAVSKQTALEMCEGIAKSANADIGIGITGIAGPGGGTDEKPVGLVYIGIYGEKVHKAFRFVFSGDRDMVRERSAMTALDMARRYALGIDFVDNSQK